MFKYFILFSAVLIELIGSMDLARAEEPGVALVNVKPHVSFEITHVCMVVKTDDPETSDCAEPKCSSGGAAVDTALASKGMRRICKSMAASVNRGFDVTFTVNGEEHVTWSAKNPEAELNELGLTTVEEHSPLNTACPQVTFKDPGGSGDNESECAPMDEVVAPPTP